MNIVERPSYTSKDVEVTSREPLFRVLFKLKKSALRHRLFNQSEYTPVLQRELIHRPEAAGVLLYNDQQQRLP
jgi:ADP-ribose pyrophosphatase